MIFCSTLPVGNKEEKINAQEAKSPNNANAEEIVNELVSNQSQDIVETTTVIQEIETTANQLDKLDDVSEPEITEDPETTVETVTKESEKEVEETTKTEITEQPIQGNYMGRFWITGYTDEEGFYYGKQTASYDTHGFTCKPGICAMNTSRRKELGLKWGDQIYVEGIGTLIVADCGCSYNTVDVWVYTDAEADSITGYRDVYYA